MLPTSEPMEWAATGEEVVTIRTDDGVDSDELDMAVDVIEQHRQEHPKINFQFLPGVNPEIAAQLEALGLETAEDILRFGTEGLETVKGIGPAKARKIIDYLEMKGNG